jgi:hypothetical protein
LNRLRDFFSVGAPVAHQQASVGIIANNREVGYIANTKRRAAGAPDSATIPIRGGDRQEERYCQERVMMGIQQGASPTRLLEMLSDRFGAFEAIASSSIKLARAAPEEELAMDVLVAEAVLEFGDDLRIAKDAASTWTRSQAEVD